MFSAGQIYGDGVAHASEKPRPTLDAALVLEVVFWRFHPVSSMKCGGFELAWVLVSSSGIRLRWGGG